MNLDWYDYGARFYDPSLGRWYVIDPAVENHLFQSPYVYSENNPVLFIDYNGEAPKWLQGAFIVIQTGNRIFKSLGFRSEILDLGECE